MPTLRLDFTATELRLTPTERDQVLAMIPKRATYRRNFVRGWHRVSGADLTGKARDYAARYWGARLSVLQLCKLAGIPLVSVQGYRGATSVWSVSALADHFTSTEG